MSAVRLRRGARFLPDEVMPGQYEQLMAALDKLAAEGQRLSSVVETADGFRVERIEHLDFTPTCESQDCAQQAVWLMFCRACGKDVAQLCDGHKAILQAMSTTMMHVETGCQQSAPMRKLVRFVPIGGKS